MDLSSRNVGGSNNNYCDLSNKDEVVINNHNQLFTSQTGDASGSQA
jgi:hypothetical protein